MPNKESVFGPAACLLCYSTAMTEEQAANLLETIPYSTVATTDEAGKPWAAPQFMLYDTSRRAVYWCASRESQHARNIGTNADVYIVTYDSMAAPGEGEGVYLRAHATMVDDAEELAEVHAKLMTKHQGVPYWGIADLHGPGAKVALFRGVIREAWVNAGRVENGQFTIVRTSIELPAK